MRPNADISFYALATSQGGPSQNEKAKNISEVRFGRLANSKIGHHSNAA